MAPPSLTALLSENTTLTYSVAPVSIQVPPPYSAEFSIKNPYLITQDEFAPERNKPPPLLSVVFCSKRTFSNNKSDSIARIPPPSPNELLLIKFVFLNSGCELAFTYMAPPPPFSLVA